MLKIPTPKLHYDMEQENPPPPFGHLSPIFNENGDRNILHNQIKFYPAKMVVQVPRGRSQTIYTADYLTTPGPITDRSLLTRHSPIPAREIFI